MFCCAPNSISFEDPEKMRTLADEPLASSEALVRTVARFPETLRRADAVIRTPHPTARGGETSAGKVLIDVPAACAAKYGRSRIRRIRVASRRHLKSEDTGKINGFSQQPSPVTSPPRSCPPQARRTLSACPPAWPLRRSFSRPFWGASP
jgi:hypothetical protein